MPTKLHGYVSPTNAGLKSELDRLDLTHQMLRITMGEKLYLAPIAEKTARILDVGTGTGIWAIEMGDEYPNADIIIGTDLSPTQPSWYSTSQLTSTSFHLC